MALIYLVGYRATGKSTIGALLARRLGHDFYDLDTCLCDSQGKSVAQIVSEDGWDAFRKLEAETLRSVTASAGANAIFATGGGVILDPANRKFMRDYGRVIWLHAPVEILTQRLGANPGHNQRPSLTGANLLEEVATVYQQREPLYAACAHCKISAAQPKEAICECIIAQLNMAHGDGKA